MQTSCAASPAKSVFTSCRHWEWELCCVSSPGAPLQTVWRGSVWAERSFYTSRTILSLSLPPAFSFSSLSITVSLTVSVHLPLLIRLSLSHFVSRHLKSFPSPQSSLSHSIFFNLPPTVKIGLALPLFHPLGLEHWSFSLCTNLHSVTFSVFPISTFFLSDITFSK